MLSFQQIVWMDVKCGIRECAVGGGLRRVVNVPRRGFLRHAALRSKRTGQSGLHWTTVRQMSSRQVVS